MTKTQNKKSSRKTKQKAPGPMRPRTRSRGLQARGSAKLTAMMEYDRMIRDPCAAPPVRAPYQGTDSGYLARTVDFWQPSFSNTGTAGTTLTVDCVFGVIPRVYLSSSIGPQQGIGLPGATLSILNQNPPTNFITATALRWRPLAACLRWVPNGAYQTRSGTVSAGYSASSKLTGGTSFTSSAVQATCLETSPNGAQMHEIRWLPGAVDQNWVSATSTGATDVDGASMQMALRNVDATQVTGTTASINGYFEVVVIWEWEPPTSSASAVMPVSPPAFTINEHQSTIPDIGSFLLRGVRNLVSSPGAQRIGMQLLTRGVGAITRSAGLLALA